MGLRDWVSEMAVVGAGSPLLRLGFNGAPRLGLGDGMGSLCSLTELGQASMGLRDWVSEMVGGAVVSRQEVSASMGLRDWVSEMARRPSGRRGRAWRGFNGAPRLGLGDGEDTGRQLPYSKALQWGSETGSRRWSA